MHRGAPPTRATSLSPHPIRGVFWLLNAKWRGKLAVTIGGTPMYRRALCMERISPKHRQECLCSLRPDIELANLD
jgi:hypothetical protein